MSTEREQKLVDIMFQLVDTAGRPSSMQWFIRLDREQRMEWVAKVLKENGFPHATCGHVLGSAEMSEHKKQPEYPPGHVMRDWSKGWNDAVDYVVGMPTILTTQSRGEAVKRLLAGAERQAHMALDVAGDLIWHSMQKYDGDPTQTSWHPICCGCVYCN